MLTPRILLPALGACAAMLLAACGTSQLPDRRSAPASNILPRESATLSDLADRANPFAFRCCDSAPCR